MSALLQAWRKTLHEHGLARAVTEASTGRSLTFRELDAAAEAWVAAQGGNRTILARRAVVFAVPNGAAWLEIFLGLLKVEAVAVPLDASEPVTAQRRFAEELRAGFVWNGTELISLPGARRYRDPTLCLLKLTSGSTGRPRALAFTGAQMLADARQVAQTMGIGPCDLNYALIPLGHSYGLGNLTIPLLAHGVPLVFGSAPLPHIVAGDFARWRPTIFPGVPAIWRVLAAADIKLDSLRLGISAGAPLSPEVARDFAARYGRRLHGFYGSSETGGIAYDRTGVATLNGSVGTAMRGVKLTGLAGQRLGVSSAAVTTFGNRRRAGGRGCWVMPDRVEFGPKGELILAGRRGTTVKIAGRRINLREVTGRLRRLPGVHDAWVGASPGPESILGAAVVTGRTAAELRAELMTDTAAWKIPKKISVLASLPLTARGKADVPALRALVFG